MCKAIVETCATCNGHHTVPAEEKCWDCRGTGFEYDRVERKCEECYGTGNFVKRRGTKGPRVTPCVRCDGTGSRVVWERGQLKCKTCRGSGKFRKRVKCTSCGGKGQEKINSMANFWPQDAEKKLQLA